MSMKTPVPLLPRKLREPPRAALDVQRVRDDFPILATPIRGKPLVYLDNAATAQKPRIVLERLRHYYETENANVHRAVHLLSERATDAYEAARLTAQRFLGVNCLREIIFTKSTTEGINLVASSFGRSTVQAGDEIVITWMEHHSNIVPWQMLCQEKGAHLRVVPINEAGELQLDDLERLLTPRTKLLALPHVSNALGTINPVKEIVALAHRRGVPVLIDGAQAAPHLPINVSDLDCDFYVFSGHKVYGPTGIGVLYGKAEHLERMPPYQGGGDMIQTVRFEKTVYNELPYKFEAGTPNIAGAIGLGAALDYVESIGREAIGAHEHQLLEYATERLADTPGVRILGTAANKAAVLSFIVEDPPMSALDVGTRLDLEGIAVRTGHHCCMPLMERFGVPGSARASFGVYNTLDEVDVFADVLRTIITEASGKVRVSLAVDSGQPASFPEASALSPESAANELAEDFDFLEDWADRYQHIIELGEKLPPMPTEMKVPENRVHGCQSTVFLQARKKPGTSDVIQFLADSDADIVRGELAILQRLYSGQKAGDVLAFDVQRFFHRLGLDQHLTMGRRNGLAEMVKRIRGFAADLAKA
jgi:cysteine desulfurase/selenocysteine lyase